MDGEEEEIASSFSSSSSPLSIDNVLVDIRKQKQLFCLCMCTVCNDESEQKQQLVSLQFVHHAKVAFFCQECDTVLENWGQLWLPETVRDLKRCLQCPYLIAGCSRCLKITSAAARLVCSDCGNKECVYLDQFVPTPPALTSQTHPGEVLPVGIACNCHAHTSGPSSVGRETRTTLSTPMSRRHGPLPHQHHPRPASLHDTRTQSVRQSR